MRTQQQSDQYRRLSASMITLAVIILFGCPHKILAQQRDGEGTNVSSSGSSTPSRTVNFNIIQLLVGERLEMFGAGGSRGILRGHPSISGIELGSTTADPVMFSTNSTERMRILANGFVGIGTTSPLYPLDVNGTATFGGTNWASHFSYNGDGSEDTYIRGGKTTSRVLINDVNSGNVLLANGGGNVGIGTATPTRRFEVLGGNIFHQWSTTAGSEYGFYTSIKNNHFTSNLYFDGLWKMLSPGKGAVISTAPLEGLGSAFSVWADNTSRAAGSLSSLTNLFNITMDGNVGVGTASPNTKLAVEGANTTGLEAPIVTSQIHAVTQGGVYQYREDAQNGHSSLRFKTYYGWPVLSLQTPLTLKYDGNVGIGTTAPTFKLDVAGQVRSSSGGFVFPDGTVQTTAGNITAVNGGSGLTGGGTTGSVALNVGAGTGVTVAADSVSVNYGSTAGTAVQGNTSITVSAGGGLSGGGSLTLGTGGSVSLTNSDRGSSQSIFKNVANASGLLQFSAASNNDTIRFQGSGGINVSFDAATKRVVIDGSTSTTAANVSAGQFGLNTGGGNYTFPNNVTVNGNIAAKYQDIAEWVPARSSLPAGTVVSLDPSNSNQVEASSRAYDTRVAGVVSAQPGVALGEQAENKVLVATTGRVRIKVDATSDPIQVGDLLVTSNVPGVAMKSQPLNIGGNQLHRPGTLIGKALEPLNGTGEILVLLSLQ